MFEVTIGNKNYDHNDVESISVYTNENGDSQAWITFKKDVPNFVGLAVSISSGTLRDFVGEVHSVEQLSEYCSKLYCVGFSSPSSSKSEPSLLPTQINTKQKAPISTKQAKKPKKKT